MSRSRSNSWWAATPLPSPTTQAFTQGERVLSVFALDDMVLVSLLWKGSHFLDVYEAATLKQLRRVWVEDVEKGDCDDDLRLLAGPPEEVDVRMEPVVAVRYQQRNS